MIEAQGLTKRYGDLLALDRLSFSADSGEVVGFLGPNGAGKTTAMRILTGFLPASDGTAEIAGHDIFQDSLAARRAVGYLPEIPPLYPEMRVDSYLRYVTQIKRMPRRAQRDAVDRAIANWGLSDVGRRVIGTLSKGYRQRVGLAQAIVHEPEVLILDEPTVGLDPIQIREIRALISDLATERPGELARTVLLSTHILPEVETLCQRVLILHRGRAVVDCSLAELRADGASLEEIFTRATTGDGGPAAELDPGDGETRS